MCIEFVNAHEVNEAFFEFVIKSNSVEVYVEFPWTMRNALIEYNPDLKHSTSKADFVKTFEKYLIENLILENSDRRQLNFDFFEELPQNGESHQNKYMLVYSGSNLARVQNTIMFNLYDNQVNYNSFQINAEKKTYETNKSNPFFYLKDDVNDFMIYLVMIGIPLLYLIIRAIKKSSSERST